MWRYTAFLILPVADYIGMYKHASSPNYCGIMFKNSILFLQCVINLKNDIHNSPTQLPISWTKIALWTKIPLTNRKASGNGFLIKEAVTRLPKHQLCGNCLWIHTQVCVLRKWTWTINTTFLSSGHSGLGQTGVEADCVSVSGQAGALSLRHANC